MTIELQSTGMDRIRCLLFLAVCLLHAHLPVEYALHAACATPNADGRYARGITLSGMATSPEDLEEALEQGRRDADAVRDHAPADGVLRIAWADGLGDSDHVRQAGELARSQGAT